MSLLKEKLDDLLNAYGFKQREESVDAELENTLQDRFKKALEQKGGTSLPSDYFGSPSQSLTSATTDTDTSTVTDTVVRPELMQTFKPQYGGARGESAKMFEHLLKMYRATGGGDKRLRLKKGEKENAMHAFVNMVDDVFAEVRKVASKTTNLTEFQLKRASKKK